MSAELCGEELARSVGMSPQWVYERDARRLPYQLPRERGARYRFVARDVPAWFEEHRRCGGESWIRDWTADADELAALETHEPHTFACERVDLERALARLNEQQRAVLHCRFVLDLTLGETGERCKHTRCLNRKGSKGAPLSVERVRQIEAKALRLLRERLFTRDDRGWNPRWGLVI